MEQYEEQFSMNENENDFFKEDNLRYFHLFLNRMARLYDVAGSLRDYTVQLNDLYKSQIDMKQNKIMTEAVYLSLGDKESKVRNPIMSTVADKVSEACECLKSRDVDCICEINPGNHFADVSIRTAKAFTWVLNRPRK